MPTQNQESPTKDTMNFGQYADGEGMSAFGTLKTSPTMLEELKARPVEEPKDWGKYASGDGMSAFGNLMEIDYMLLAEDEANANRDIRTEFGQSSPYRHLYEQVYDEPEQEIQTLERSLEDLYREYPQLKLGSLETTSMYWAADCVFQIIDEAVVEWLAKWCPDLKLSEVRATLHGEIKDAKKFDVPPEALDQVILQHNSLPEMFTACYKIFDPRNVHDEHVPFSKLIALMDQTIAFHALIKDKHRHDRLKQYKGIFLWFPAALDTKKLEILRNANARLSHVREKKYNTAQENVYNPQQQWPQYMARNRASAEEQQRKADEKHILENAFKAFKTQREHFRRRMIKALLGLMKDTAPPDSNPNNYVKAESPDEGGLAGAGLN
ncbi:hypothetical protein F5Y16DRAFT_420004 [Xylariaceae sp. FL0255]|nr:hypothetical protein F5Y16DRAFT_420004 [Xylariaceae sp. FL0255]